jgi:polysaccharide export outer membrane protein
VGQRREFHADNAASRTVVARRRRLCNARTVNNSALVLASLCCAACSNVGRYVWVEDFPQRPPASSQGYLIASGDLISVRVFNQDGMSARGRVRADGKFSMPLLHDIDAAGYTPEALGQQLQSRLKEFIHSPTVTVALEETKPIAVSVMGEVTKPGLYLLEARACGLLQAVAMAGGLTDYAHHNRIFVVRQASTPVRIRFRYDSLVKAEGPAAQFRLQDGDVLVVE